MMMEFEHKPSTGRGLGDRVALLLRGKLGGRAALSIPTPVGVRPRVSLEKSGLDCEWAGGALKGL